MTGMTRMARMTGMTEMTRKILKIPVMLTRKTQTTNSLSLGLSLSSETPETKMTRGVTGMNKETLFFPLGMLPLFAS